MAAAPPGRSPQLVGGQVPDGGLDVFANLLQGVRCGLEIGLDAGHRAAEPHFGNVVHAGNDIGDRLYSHPGERSRSGGWKGARRSTNLR